jgi:predicted phosphodiesterase
MHRGTSRPNPRAACGNGHSHQLKIETKNGTLFFNPGSAGPPASAYPSRSAAMTAEHGKLRAEIVELSAAVAASVPIAERFAS